MMMNPPVPFGQMMADLVVNECRAQSLKQILAHHVCVLLSTYHNAAIFQAAVTGVPMGMST